MPETIKEAFLIGKNYIVEDWLFFMIGGMFLIFVPRIVSIWWNMYLHRIRHNYVHHIKWVLYQIRFPKENLKSPKAMEQVIASLHGTFEFGMPWRKEYIKGAVEDRFSLEMVGKSDGVRFYGRVMDENKRMFEAAFFSQYPEVELTEVDDYMNDLPDDLPNDEYNIFGTDYFLANKEGDAYPIKTYEFFDSPEEEHRLDPMATIAEACSNLREDETFLIQLLISGTGVQWNHKLEEEAKKIREKLTGQKEEEEHKSGLMHELGAMSKNIAYGFVREPQFAGQEEEKMQFSRFPTIAESQALKAVENKLSKNLFDSILRFVYVYKRGLPGISSNAFFGAVTQFSDRNLNSFKPLDSTFLLPSKMYWVKGSSKRWFKKSRLKKKARHMYEAYKERAMPLGHHSTFRERAIREFHSQTSVLSAEELATIYHPPGAPIGSQKLAPIEMKKSSPPSSLPIIND